LPTVESRSTRFAPSPATAAVNDAGADLIESGVPCCAITRLGVEGGGVSIAADRLDLGLSDVLSSLVAFLAVTAVLNLAFALRAEVQRLMAELVGRYAQDRIIDGHRRRPGGLREPGVPRPAAAGPDGGQFPAPQHDQ